MAEEGVIVADDHWTNPGGQTLDALEHFLSERTGDIVRITEVTLLASVAELMQVVFDIIPN